MAKKYIIPIFVPNLGCPFRCVFCDQKVISGAEGKPDVGELIEKYLVNIKVKGASVEVAFYGGSFTALPLKTQKSLLEKVLPYIREGKVSSIRISTRPDKINYEILSFLKDYRVKTIELGAQSMNDEVLFLAGRGHNADAVREASRQIKKRGFILGIQLMPGLPGDTYESIIETTREVVAIKPEFVRIYPTVVVRGTELERMYLKGEYKPLSLDVAVKVSADMYIIFVRSNIRVIRMGLQPTEKLLERGFVLAGPFHPSFGDLVKGEVALRELRNAIKDFTGNYKGGKSLNIKVPLKKVSIFIGQRGKNKEEIEDSFNKKIIIRGEEALEHHFIIAGEGYEKKYGTLL